LKISDLIQQLIELQGKHGNSEVLATETQYLPYDFSEKIVYYSLKSLLKYDENLNIFKLDIHCEKKTMKISDLIRKLTQIKRAEGDLQIVVYLPEELEDDLIYRNLMDSDICLTNETPKRLEFYTYSEENTL
jgi:predicted CopG family antitoxin